MMNLNDLKVISTARTVIKKIGSTNWYDKTGKVKQDIYEIMKELLGPDMISIDYLTELLDALSQENERYATALSKVV